MAKQKNAKSVGTLLREAREARKQELSFVSDALRIRENHLAAIEEGNMESLPAPAYAAGFIRTYANYLGLDENEMIALFKEEAGKKNRVMLDFPVMDDARELPSMTLIAGLLIIVGIIYLFWIFLSDAQNTVRDRAGGETQMETSSTSATGTSASDIIDPDTRVPDTQTQTSRDTNDNTNKNIDAPTDDRSIQIQIRALPPTKPIIKIHAKGETWMRIENEEGRILFSSIIRTGEDFPLPQGAYFILATGNAGQLEFWVGDEPVGNIGANGQRLDGRKIFPNRIMAQANESR